MRRKIVDIEEQLRRNSSTSGPVHPAPYPSPVSHGRDDIQSILREKDSYIEQLKTEKYESVRNFEREKNRLVLNYICDAVLAVILGRILQRGNFVIRKNTVYEFVVGFIPRMILFAVQINHSYSITL